MKNIHEPDSPVIAAQDELLLPGGPAALSRRAFLQYAGFGFASAALAGCSRGPEQALLTNALAPVGIVPGRAYWMATTCRGCSAGCGVLAKCTDGRPIKLEGNPEDALSRGGLCAVGQAEVLAAYDSRRASVPNVEGRETTWEAVDDDLRARLAEARAAGGGIRLLTGTVNSPSTLAWIARLGDQGGDFAHVQYDPLSSSAILDAHHLTHGVRALPAYRFGAARVVASFDADFLGTWIAPVAFAAGWAEARRPDDAEPRMSRHVQFESRLSVTGMAADGRHRVAPTELPGALSALCGALERRAGGSSAFAEALAGHRLEASLDALASELWEARGESLVVSGSNDVAVQCLANHANWLLGNYGRTLSLGRPSLQRRGSDSDVQELLRELEAGAVRLLVVSGVNPAYELPLGAADALARAGTLVVHSDGQDETSALASHRLPSLHALESWDDAEPEQGRFTLTQPTLSGLRKGRTLRELLARLCADPRSDHELLRAHWAQTLHARLLPAEEFDVFFRRALHDGYVEQSLTVREPAYDAAHARPLEGTPPAAEPTLVLFAKVGLLHGAHAHNPWLQELPDPVSKTAWGNHVCLSESRAARLGVADGDVVTVGADEGGTEVELPVLVQAGQHDDVVAVALGYGRLGTERFADIGPDWFEARPTVRAGQPVGAHVGGFARWVGGTIRHDATRVRVRPVGRREPLAKTQDYDLLELPERLAPHGAEVRDAALTTSFERYTRDPSHALPHAHVPQVDLWPEDHPKTGHHWGMAVDLAACTGCSACVVSCQAENNVPVVGRDEVQRHREMHWLRIDRYLEGSGDDLTAVQQPMFCQQCDNAPCEAVCPVLATVHSSEGLNQQVYNRCVGTRYCANTCPYKVRRFNWFDYPREDELQNQQLNPDVTVRSRGVMEKCTFCVQRIQEAKAEALRRGVELADGDVLTACQQSCPTRAIVFGDVNDPDSAVSRLWAGQRAYGVLSEINVEPTVRYLARVRNTRAADDVEERHG